MQSGPPLLVALGTIATVLLAILGPGVDEAPREGRVLVLLRMQDVGPDQVCVAPFEVPGGYERMNLNHDLDTAIKPRAALIDPDGGRRMAEATAQGLDLEVERPTAGTWTLRVWVESSPGLATGIDQGEVFMLGFPKDIGGRIRPTQCSGADATPTTG